MRNIVKFSKEIKLRKCRKVIIFFEESIVNKNRFQMFLIKLIIVKMQKSETIQKIKKAFFRKCKFDVLIKFI
jgi:hypothetical protein